MRSGSLTHRHSFRRLLCPGVLVFHGLLCVSIATKWAGTYQRFGCFSVLAVRRQLDTPLLPAFNLIKCLLYFLCPIVFPLLQPLRRERQTFLACS